MLLSQPPLAMQRHHPTPLTHHNPAAGCRCVRGKQVALNPADTTIVPPGSQLVFVASSATDVVPLPTPYEVGCRKG